MRYLKCLLNCEVSRENMGDCWARIWCRRRRNTDGSETGTGLIKVIRISIPREVI